MVYVVVHDLSRKWTIQRTMKIQNNGIYSRPRNDKIMEHIQAHDLSKKWTIQKTIFQIKRRLVYKTINQLKKCARQPEKRAKTQRYRYSASLLSNKNRRKNNNLQSGSSRSFCYSLAKSKRFCTFDIASRRTKENAPAEGHGLHPFFGPLWSKKFTAFFGPQSGLEKNRREQTHRKNCPQQFLLAHLLLKK